MSKRKSAIDAAASPLRTTELELVPIDHLQEHPRNPNVGDLDVLGDSVDTHGFVGAVIAQRGTGYVLDGNHRLRLARERGYAQLPVLWVDLDDDAAAAFMLAANEIARKGSNDPHALAALLQELVERDRATGTGFRQEEITWIVTHTAAWRSDVEASATPVAIPPPLSDPAPPGSSNASDDMPRASDAAPHASDAAPPRELVIVCEDAATYELLRSEIETTIATRKLAAYVM